MVSYRTRKRPLIFIPGLFGSMSDLIIPGTGNWSFGMAGAFYEPFVRQLEEMGYQRNISLFVAFYDWRQPIPYSAHTYLYRTIQEVKQKTGSSHVNLLGHSLGGLVSRAYVQSAYYQDDVDQLISICSPNAGSPVNYCYWTGETFEPSPEAQFNVVSFYMNKYLDYLTQTSQMGRVEAIHTYFPSLLNVVPSQDYGDYLIVQEPDAMRLIPYQRIKVQNLFLDELNRCQNLIKTRNIEVTLIAGMEKSTIQFLKRDINNTMSSINSHAGDGNVMVSSVFALEGDRYLVKGGHMEALFSSYSLLKRKLT